MNFISLFAGIGGIDLGLERAGMSCIAQVEINPFCLKVLSHHWPQVPRFTDVTKFCRRISDCEAENEDGVICPRCKTEFGDCECIGTDQFTDNYGFPNVIAAGFECQDISVANWTGAQGISGTRSGLWKDVLRIVRELGPDYLLLENSPKITTRGIDVVCGDLASIGYSIEWACLKANQFGSPQKRERFVAIAYPSKIGQQEKRFIFNREHGEEKPQYREFAGMVMPTRDFWAIESPPPAVDDGFPFKLAGKSISAIGNSCMPQMAEYLGKLIMADGTLPK